jgi:hypothetical protein
MTKELPIKLRERFFLDEQGCIGEFLAADKERADAFPSKRCEPV